MALNTRVITSADDQHRIRLAGDMNVSFPGGLTSTFLVTLFTVTSEVFELDTDQWFLTSQGTLAKSMKFGGAPRMNIDLMFDPVGGVWYVVGGDPIRRAVRRLVSSYSWDTGNTASVAIASATSNVVSTAPFLLTATPSPGAKVSKVDFYRNNTLIKTVFNAPYTTSEAFAVTDNGTYQYKAVMTDQTGNTYTSDLVSVVVAFAAAPVPTLGTDVTEVSVATTITLAATFANGAVPSKVEFYKGTTLVGTKTSAPFSITQPFVVANNGTYAYKARAYTTAGATADSNVVSVHVAIPNTTDVTALTMDSTVTAAATAALNNTAEDAAKKAKRLAVAQAIVNQFAPSHTLTIYKDGVAVFNVTFDGGLVINNTGADYTNSDILVGNITIGLGPILTGAALSTQDINAGAWTFLLAGGAGGQRSISGTVGPTGSGKNLILSDSPVINQIFDAVCVLTLDRSIDGLLA